MLICCIDDEDNQKAIVTGITTQSYIEVGKHTKLELMTIDKEFGISINEYWIKDIKITKHKPSTKLLELLTELEEFKND